VTAPACTLSTGVVMIVAVTLVATGYAGWRLRTLRLTGDE
jgi:hypothetical protein